MVTIPSIASWILLGKCNMKCAHCYPESSADYSGKVLTVEQQFESISKLAEAEMKMICLSGGEAFILPHLFGLIKSIRAHGMRVWISSNGSLIDEKIAAKLAAANIDGISISLDSAEEIIHDDFRKFKGAYQRAISAVKHLVDYGVTVDLDHTATSVNGPNIANIVELADRLGVDSIFLKRFRPIGRGSKNMAELSLQINDYKSLIENFFMAAQGRNVQARTEDPAAIAYMKRIGKQDLIPNGLTKAVGCFAGIAWIGIQPNGDITPCPLLDVPIGNILHSNLKQLISDSPLIKTLQNRDERGGECGSCDMRENCGGCRAHAYSLTNDVTAEDPYCAYAK